MVKVLTQSAYTCSGATNAMTLSLRRLEPERFVQKDVIFW